MSGSQRVRCAVYTRKSSEEGLEQSFNSLDAQREACAAYILSQASESWTEVKEHYDDGGLSGGTLERPALQRLLADVAAGRVDIIVVYKVDRLTRSLLDFAKLVEAFDKAGTSFVSVTQSFNTTTSMGRLTLNMLLSFAQFEREVTAERIRDKIAASKAKGMWMGGTPPIGYAPDGRTLRIVEADAELIRYVFRRYLALGNVRLVADELKREQVALPIRERLNGSGTIGGGWFSRGQLYKILSNPIYIGRIAHGATTYAGLHPAIVDTHSWQQAQARLADNQQGSRSRARAASPSLLAGRVVDAEGQPLIATHASKAGRRYRYYVSKALHDGPAGEGLRIPAAELEAAVTERTAQAFDDPIALAGSAGLALKMLNFADLEQRTAETAALLRKRDRATADALIDQVRVASGRIEVELRTSAIAASLRMTATADACSSLTFVTDVALTRTGRTMRLVQGGKPLAGQQPDRSLIRLLIKAQGWWTQLRTGEVDIKRLAQQEGVNPSYVTRVLRLAFLSPAAVEAALTGMLAAGIDAAALTATSAVAASWKRQAEIILPH